MDMEEVEKSQHEHGEEPKPAQASQQTVGFEDDGLAAESNAANGDETNGKCYLWMTHHQLGWLARLPGKWPRTFALIFGVIIPLFVLIGVSLFFGYGLAHLEAPGEIDANNEIIANRAFLATTREFNANVTIALPRICLEILTENSTQNTIPTLEQELDEIFSQVITKKPPKNETTNATVGLDEELPIISNGTAAMLTFMTDCGKLGQKMATEFTSFAVDQEYIVSDLSFNWIRCDGLGRNSSNSLGQQLWGRPFVDRSQLKPDAQVADAVAAWRNDSHLLYTEYLEELLEQNETSEANARIKAFEHALETANGFGHCYPNSAAGAWFWFTVMTTIGYGNAAPATEGGRAMIYTLGFFSILLFAIILGAAGTIVVTIWDDFINRTKLYHFNYAWVACIFWGCCYYAWMLVIAAVTQNWKAARLGEEMEFSEAYWFSYISTTTVGLGDYYLDHVVILRQDLFVFPIMFLTGFVLLANFFVKLTEVIGNLIPRNRPTLEEKLASSETPCMPNLHPVYLKELSIKQAVRLKSVTMIQSERLKSGIGSINPSRRSPSEFGDDERDEMADTTPTELAAAAVKALNNDDTVGGEAAAQTRSIPVEAAGGWQGTVTSVGQESASSVA